MTAMTPAIVALYAAIGFCLSAVTTAIAIPGFARLQFRQHAYEDAPATHAAKTGTPTMGGVAFVTALLPLAVLPLPMARAILGLVLGCAAVGFADDLTSIVRGKNLGLRARTKFLLTALIAIVFLRVVSASSAVFPHDALLVTPWMTWSVPHWLWLLLGILAVTGTIHSVNLTDGLDGLATGAVVPPLLALGASAWEFRIFGATAAAALAIGGCAGFLLFNRHPARIFMGDTGSLALGALLSGIAIVTGEMVLLILVGFVFVAEALSVILQVAYFKRTGGKRIFRMSPLHHHFELTGWPETRVTRTFWAVSALCSLAGYALVR